MRFGIRSRGDLAVTTAVTHQTRQSAGVECVPLIGASGRESCRRVASGTPPPVGGGPTLG
jgi:hypothetical protein